MVYSAFSDDSSTVSQFTRRKKITITTDGTSTPVDYQVKLTITYESEMEVSFADIRFNTKAGVYIDMWQESHTDSTTADIWVELPDAITDPSSDYIWMYYGNTSLSDGGDVGDAFLFGDDFPGSSLDTSKWDEYGTVTDSVSGGILTTSSAGGYDAGHALLSDSSYGTWTDLIVESRLKSDVYPSSSWEPGTLARATDPGVDDDTYGASFYSSSGLVGGLYEFVGGAYNSIQTPSGATDDTNWHNCKFEIAGTSLKVYQDGTLITSTTDSSHASGRIGLGNSGGTRSGKYEWVFVRKYIANEPTPSYGAAQHQRRVPQFIG